MTAIGNLTADPMTTYSPNGRMMVKGTVAVNRPRRDGVDQGAQFFRWTAWGQLAETLDRLVQQGALVKGRQLFVSGNFDAREYTTDKGETRTSLDINADTVLMTGTNPNAGTEPTF
jgi:single-strand DNA-binding protein